MIDIDSHFRPHAIIIIIIIIVVVVVVVVVVIVIIWKFSSNGRQTACTAQQIRAYTLIFVQWPQLGATAASIFINLESLLTIKSCRDEREALASLSAVLDG